MTCLGKHDPCSGNSLRYLVCGEYPLPVCNARFGAIQNEQDGSHIVVANCSDNSGERDSYVGSLHMSEMYIYIYVHIYLYLERETEESVCMA